MIAIIVGNHTAFNGYLYTYPPKKQQKKSQESTYGYTPTPPKKNNNKKSRKYVRFWEYTLLTEQGR